MATLIAEKSLASTKTAIPIAIRASQVPRSIGCWLASLATARTLSAAPVWSEMHARWR
jgi:hypothetical protein